MGEDDEARFVAWHHEMRAVHQRVRDALEVARESLRSGDATAGGGDLLLYCRGFCTALSAHHTSEDGGLFPAIAARHPGLAAVLDKLRQDHSMIAHLVTELDRARGASAEEAERHLDGIGAIMESHFQYEERQLLTVLETLDLVADRNAMLGPL